MTDYDITVEREDETVETYELLGATYEPDPTEQEEANPDGDWTLEDGTVISDFSTMVMVSVAEIDDDGTSESSVECGLDTFRTTIDFTGTKADRIGYRHSDFAPSIGKGFWRPNLANSAELNSPGTRYILTHDNVKRRFNLAHIMQISDVKLPDPPNCP